MVSREEDLDSQLLREFVDTSASINRLQESFHFSHANHLLALLKNLNYDQTLINRGENILLEFNKYALEVTKINEEFNYKHTKTVLEATTELRKIHGQLIKLNNDFNNFIKQTRSFTNLEQN